MKHPYQVKADKTVEKDGQSYKAKDIVFLSVDEYIHHASSVNPIRYGHDSELPSDSVLVAHKSEDFIQYWYLEKYSIDIEAIATASISIVTTKTNHYLASGQPINLRIQSSTIGTILQTIATVTGPKTFSVPAEVILPDVFDYAEVGIPIDLTQSTITGGLRQAWSTVSTEYTITGTARTTKDLRRVIISGSSYKELASLQVGDKIWVIYGTQPYVVITGLSEITEKCPKTRCVEFTRILTVDKNSAATLETDQIYGIRSNPVPGVGDFLTAQQFGISGNPLYGEIIARLETNQFVDLETEIYPFEVKKIEGINETLLIKGQIGIKA